MDVTDFSDLVRERATDFACQCRIGPRENLLELEWWERFLEYLDLHEVDINFNSGD